jgi:hypothetical protein
MAIRTITFLRVEANEFFFIPYLFPFHRSELGFAGVAYSIFDS